MFFYKLYMLYIIYILDMIYYIYYTQCKYYKHYISFNTYSDTENLKSYTCGVLHTSSVLSPPKYSFTSSLPNYSFKIMIFPLLVEHDNQLNKTILISLELVEQPVPRASDTALPYLDATYSCKIYNKYGKKLKEIEGTHCLLNSGSKLFIDVNLHKYIKSSCKIEITCNVITVYNRYIIC